MPHVIHALDRADAGDLRAATRPEHLAYLGGFDVLYGGPLLEDNGRMCGSLIVLDVDSREAAEEFAACLLYTSPSPRDLSTSRMPSSA